MALEEYKNLAGYLEVIKASQKRRVISPTNLVFVY